MVETIEATTKPKQSIEISQAGRANLIPWQPGQSGNPGGRPKQNKTVTELALQEAPAAFSRIVELARSVDPSVDPKLKLQANTYIIDRAYGKAAQSVNVSGEVNIPITITVGTKTIQGALPESIVQPVIEATVVEEISNE